MLRRKALIAAVGATLAAGTAAFAPAAHADRVGFNLSFGGPGYGVTVGNAPYYYAPRYVAPAYVSTYVAPAYVSTYVAPPAYSYYTPPVYYAEPVVVAAPYRYYHYRPYGRVYYRHR